MKNENNKEKIDVPRLNEVIKIGRNMLKVAWAFMIIGLIVLVTYLFKEWKLLEFVGAILSIISPFFIGIIIAWLLDPIVNWLQKNGIKRVFGTIIVYLVFLAILILFFVLMIPALVDQVNEFINFAPDILDYLKTTAEGIFDKMSNIYTYDFNDVKTQLYSALSNLFTSLTVGLPNKIIGFASSFISGGLNVVFGLFVGFYMLFDFNNVRKHLLSFIPKKIHSDAITLTDELNKTLKGYVQGTLLIMLILFVFQSVALAIAGLSSPMLFGLFCAITNVIPYIGPYIGGAPAVIVGFTISPVTGFACLICVVVAQLLESYFLNPIVMSKTMKLHPVTIMLSLLIFGHFFGILGMVFATPIVSCLKVVANFINQKYEIINIINNR